MLVIATAMPVLFALNRIKFFHFRSISPTRTSLFILGFFLTQSLWAQSADADKAYLMDVLKSDDIDPSSVRAFYTKDGVSYFATPEGVFSFNGAELSELNFFLPDSLQAVKNEISDFLFHKDSWWLATYTSGLIQIDLRQGTVRQWSVVNSPLPSNRLNALTLVNDELWLTPHYFGVFRLLPSGEMEALELNTSDTKYAADRTNITSINTSSEQKNIVWLTAGVGLLRYDLTDKNADFFPFSEKEGQLTRRLRRSCFVGDSLLYTTSFGSGLWVFNVFDYSYEQFLYAEGKERSPAANSSRRITPYDKNTLILPYNSNRGPLFFDCKQKQFRSVHSDMANFPGGEKQLSFYFRSGARKYFINNQVISTELSRKSNFRVETLQDRIDRSVWITDSTIVYDRWQGMQQNAPIVHYNLYSRNSQPYIYPKPDFLSFDRLVALFPGEGTEQELLVTLTGVYICQDRVCEAPLCTFDIPGYGWCDPIAVSRFGKQLIVSTKQDLLLEIDIESGAYTIINETSTGQSFWREWTMSLHHDAQGTVWCGKKGIAYRSLADTTFSLIPYKDILSVAGRNDIGNCRAVYTRDSLQYFGFNKGILVVQNKDFEQARFIRLPEEILLRNFQVLGQQEFIVFSDQGVFFTKETEYSPTWSRLFLPTMSSYASVRMTQDSVKMSGYDDKYLSFPLDRINKQVKPPNFEVTGIYHSDASGIGALKTPETEVLSLPTEQNFVVFQWQMSNSEQVYIPHYYRLRGLSDTWEPAGAYELRFSGLLPGAYQFELRNKQGDIKNIPFEIRTPWYRRIELWIAALCLILLGAFLIYRWRAREYRLQQNLREELLQSQMRSLRTQMNPHFMFNSLNSLKSLMIDGDIKKSIGYLNKFSKLMRMVLEHSKTDFVPLEAELKALRYYIELEQLRFNQPFNYRVEMDSDLSAEDIPIPPMLIQPFAENAIWHGLLPKGSAGLVTVQVKKQENDVQIGIIDDGVGRSHHATRARHKSLGIAITRERLALLERAHNWSASISIEDLKDEGGKNEGTAVWIVIKEVKREDF